MASETQIYAIGTCATGILPKSAIRNTIYDINPKCSTIVENPLQIGPFMQNKANVKIGKMNISVAKIKAYDNEQRTTNNERYSKQTQFKANSNPNKANLHLTAENAEYAEKKNICVSDCSIKRYALYPISPRSLRTRRLMKNKAKTNPIKPNFKREGTVKSRLPRIPEELRKIME